MNEIIFFHPFTCMIAGPSQSGKSTLLLNILKFNKKLIYPPPNKIMYCHSTNSISSNDVLNIKPTIEFHRGLPDITQLTEDTLIILDDLMSEVENNQHLVNIFTRESHHSNISIFFITQNLFSKGKYSRTIALNCQYLIIMNNPRDKSQINYLAKQMYPSNSKFLIKAYENATSKKYGYLFLDLTQKINNELRVQTNITPIEFPRIIYGFNYDIFRINQDELNNLSENLKKYVFKNFIN
jgi:hypothetical protein